MATNILKHAIHYSGLGPPLETDVFPDLKNNNTYQDLNPGGELYRYKTTGWAADKDIYGIKIPGPQGPIGPQGIKGDTGPQGPPGTGGSGSITKIVATANGDIALPSPVNHTGIIVIVNAKLFNLRLTGAIVNGISNPLVQQTTALISDNTQFIIIN